jgi:mannose-6-phosphate isomerase-like protein (cupin superfamily)
MKGFVDNIEAITLANENFRTVLYTDDRLQLVVMHLQPREDIGEEVHTLDQFLRVESGKGTVVLDGEERGIENGTAIVIPAGVRHNVTNTENSEPLKLYSIYTPPQHEQGTVHRTKAEAEASEEHYTG